MLNIWKKRYRDHDSIDFADGGTGNNTLNADGAGPVPPQGDAFGSAIDCHQAPSKTLDSNTPEGPSPKKKKKKSHARRDEAYSKPDDELQPTVYGSSDLDLQRTLQLPTSSEVTVLYDAPSLEHSELLTRVQSFDLSGQQVKREYALSNYALEGVGKWGAEWAWKQAAGRRQVLEETQPREEIWDFVDGWTVGCPELDMTSKDFNISPKAVRLVQLLEACEMQGDGLIGVVFGTYYVLFRQSEYRSHLGEQVRRRIVALALFALIQSLQLGNNLPFLRPMVLTGDNAIVCNQVGRCDSVGLFLIVRYTQVTKDIANGVANFLIATRSFEDCELPQATLVIQCVLLFVFLLLTSATVHDPCA